MSTTFIPSAESLMDPTVAFLWSRSGARMIGVPVEAPASHEWAVHLLEQGHDSEAIRWLTDPDPALGMKERLIYQILHEIGRDELLDLERLKDAFEAESIADYFDDKIDGWTLINRGCRLFYDDFSGTGPVPPREFWIRVCEDAGEHGGQGLCAEYPFSGGDFDEVLKKAIRESNRPLPAGITRVSKTKRRRD